MTFSSNNAKCVLEAIFGGGSGTFSSSVSEDDNEEDVLSTPTLVNKLALEC